MQQIRINAPEILVSLCTYLNKFCPCYEFTYQIVQEKHIFLELKSSPLILLPYTNNRYQNISNLSNTAKKEAKSLFVILAKIKKNFPKTIPTIFISIDYETLTQTRKVLTEKHINQ